MEKKEKNLIEEALTPNNGWKPWERVLGVAFGAILIPAHKFDTWLKDKGIESKDDSFEIDSGDYR